MTRMSFWPTVNLLPKIMLNASIFVELLKALNFPCSNLKLHSFSPKVLTIGGLTIRHGIFFTHGFLKKLMDAFNTWENSRLSTAKLFEASIEILKSTTEAAVEGAKYNKVYFLSYNVSYTLFPFILAYLLLFAF